MNKPNAQHRQCVDANGQRTAWCACWFDGSDDGYARGIEYATANPDPALVEARAREWLHAQAVEVTRAAAEQVGPEHDERRAREAAGLARARARWDRPSVGLVAGGGDAA